MEPYKFISETPPLKIHGYDVFEAGLEGDYDDIDFLLRDVLWKIVKINGYKYRVVGAEKNLKSDKYSQVVLMVEYVH